MAAVYPHKSHGFMVKYSLCFPDGTVKSKYKYFDTRTIAEHVRKSCEHLEAGSRSLSLSPRDIIHYRHEGLVSEQEARDLSGGKVAAVYSLDRVMAAYREAISLSHTPVAFEKAYSKAMLIAGWLKTHPIPSLSDIDVRGYVLDRQTGKIKYPNAKTGFCRDSVGSKTILNEINILSGIIREAIRLGMVTENVAAGVTVPVKRARLRRSLSLAEINRLMDALEKNSHLMHGQIRAFVLTALYTGFRRSELRTLCWDDIDFDTRRIKVQSKTIDGEPDFNPKTGQARSKTIPDKLYDILLGLERKGRFVFGGSAPYHVDSISQAVRKVMRRAGLKEVSLHHCRHTFGSWMLKKTGDLSLVASEMGHADLATTKKYLHTVESPDDPSRSFEYS